MFASVTSLGSGLASGGMTMFFWLLGSTRFSSDSFRNAAYGLLNLTSGFGLVDFETGRVLFDSGFAAMLASPYLSTYAACLRCRRACECAKVPAILSPSYIKSRVEKTVSGYWLRSILETLLVGLEERQHTYPSSFFKSINDRTSVDRSLTYAELTSRDVGLSARA
jgi:hypothetical protein